MPSRTPSAGDYFRHYALVAPLGHGGMSDVLLAYDLEAARVVALKFLLGIHADTPSMVARMRREGEIYRGLSHRSIVEVLEVAEAPEEGVPIYLSLEYLRGRTLHEVLQDRGGPLPVPAAIHILEDVASALQLAHSRGVVHLDVKPSNILVDQDGRATLVDFGVASADDDFSEAIGRGIGGTLAYSAPEQRAGASTGPLCDVYALGAVLYEMLSGRRATPIGTAQEMLAARTQGLPPPSALVPTVPPLLDQLCEAMLDEDPEDRWPDLRSLLVDLGLKRVQLDEATRDAVFGDRTERALDEALVALNEGRPGRAVELVDPLLEAGLEGPREADAHYLRARALAASGRPGEALLAFAEARERAPADPDMLADLVLLLLRMGRLAEASSAILEAPQDAREGPLVLGLAELCRSFDEVPDLVMEVLSGRGSGRVFQKALRSLRAAEG